MVYNYTYNVCMMSLSMSMRVASTISLTNKFPPPKLLSVDVTFVEFLMKLKALFVVVSNFFMLTLDKMMSHRYI